MPTEYDQAVADRLRGTPGIYWLARTARARVQALRGPMVVEGVPGRVHRNDVMMEGDDESSQVAYVQHALEAVAFVTQALEDTGHVPLDSDVLDYGCGHGRVTRHLAKRCRMVSACDLDHEGVRFCAAEFGAAAIYGATDVEEVRFSTYDAIWLGSVITHHPAAHVQGLLRHLAQHLRPSGVVVVSRSGERALEGHLGSQRFAWLAEEAPFIRRELERDGNTYRTYPQNPGGEYGLGFQTAEWLDEHMQWLGLSPVFGKPEPWVMQEVQAWRGPDL